MNSLTPSILRSTGQAWKLYLFHGGNIAVVLLGSVLFFGDVIPEALRRELMLVIGLLGAVCIIFPIVGIRCPTCGTRWLWQALHNMPGKRFPRLLELGACPVCGMQHDGRQMAKPTDG